jgi:putative AbiEi antitoxin of type IV toxin-antitoxin system/uncharacterized protein DUF559/transcriptional regulator with AbiEi antitoxin domain of type IV toxin-antitoxin system
VTSERNRAVGREGRDLRISADATAQGGVVSLGQLEAAGLGQRGASHRARRGQLHRVHHGVYAVGHRSLGRVGLLRAALLACGEGALVSHKTSAALWGLSDKQPVLIDVTVRGQAGRKIEGIRCRRCRYPLPEEVAAWQGVPCTTPARTLVDLAGLLGNDSLREAVERAAVLKLLDLAALDRAIAAAKGRRGVPWLRAILVDWRWEGGTAPDLRSLFEARVLPRLVANGLARPVCNEILRLGDRRLRPDFLWPAHRFIVETDGEGSHGTPVAFQRDRKRDQVLLAAGYRVARVTWKQMRDEPDGVVARIRLALAGR